MPYYIELPDWGGVRPLTTQAPRVVEATASDSILYIREPEALRHRYPRSAHWVEVPGPCRVLSEAEWVSLLEAAGADPRRVALARARLTPMDLLELQGEPDER